MLFPTQAASVSPAIFGIALIVLMFVLPDGIVGGARRLWRGGSRTLRTPPSEPRDARDAPVDLSRRN